MRSERHRRSFVRVLVVVLVAFVTVVAAAPHKVLVLPVDGDADPALRKSLDATVQKLAHQIGGSVTVGDTTFADTAAAVGCDPGQPACADNVLGTLAVDELVWGTATTVNGQTTVVVKRATKAGVREQSATVDANDPAAVAGALGPLFGGEAPAGTGAGTGAGSGSGTEAGSAAGSGTEAGTGSGTEAGSGTGSGSGSGSGSEMGSGAAVVEQKGPPWSHDKKVGLGLVAGGGVALVVGLALWANESDLQGQIDSTPLPESPDQVQSLRSLEDKAQSYATWGNVMVIAGLAAGGAGAYFLWKDHQSHVTAVTPAPVDGGTGMTIVVGGRW